MVVRRKSDDGVKLVVIPAPNIEHVAIPIRGIAPLCISRFSKKAELMDKMAEGSTAKNKRVRKARDYAAEVEDAKHVSLDGWEGINASAFRRGAIDACRLCGFQMVMAKMTIFAVEDGYSAESTPLVRIYGPGAEMFTAPVRNASGGADIRARPIYKKWGCMLNFRYDRDQFEASSVLNLVARVGMQIGVGEGRPFSKESAGIGLGMFQIVPTDQLDEFREEFGIPAG